MLLKHETIMYDTVSRELRLGIILINFTVTEKCYSYLAKLRHTLITLSAWVVVGVVADGIKRIEKVDYTNSAVGTHRNRLRNSENNVTPGSVTPRRRVSAVHCPTPIPNGAITHNTTHILPEQSSLEIVW